MPVSHAEQATLTCPQCGHEFTADIWLIVDAAERPDLIERIRDGTLHRITCPRCGHAWGLDAPLLLFTPPEMGTNRPPLLFSPAQQTSTEEDSEHAAALLARLRDALGDAWQDEWLENMAVVPQPLLAVVLADDPQAAIERLAEGAQHAAPLHDIARLLAEAGDLGHCALQDFIAADTWTASRRILENNTPNCCPATPTPCWAASSTPPAT
ncbi:MAG: CpXC domain-containing protein [Ardenticatenia bacterium]|nr:CpXC domain-containing protein [Ardenticatenia bacterium]